MKTIVLTGGGTAGHVTPHFSLLDYFNDNDIDIEYIGSVNGIERQLVTEKKSHTTASAAVNFAATSTARISPIPLGSSQVFSSPSDIYTG